MSQAGKFSFNVTPGATEFFQGNSGGPVGPDVNDTIFLLGSGNITVTGNPLTNTLTISNTGFSAFTRIFADQTLAVNNAYACVGGGVLNLTLPATSALGDFIEITLDGSTGFTILQNAGQSIKLGNLTTTVGVGGSLTTTAQGDSILIRCSETDLKWNVFSSMGNFLVV